MSEAFDPYYSWLGIPPTEQPADYYRLLGIDRFESNAEVIANAADRQMRHVRTFQLGENAQHSQRLLNELAAARACLANTARKAAYDQQLRGRIFEQNPPPVNSPVPAATFSAKRSASVRPRNAAVEVVKIVVGGIAGLTIGVLLLWYGFGIDVSGVMESRDGRTAKLLAQNDADVQPKPPLQDENRLDRAREAKLPAPRIRPEQRPDVSDSRMPVLPKVQSANREQPPLSSQRTGPGKADHEPSMAEANQFQLMSDDFVFRFPMYLVADMSEDAFEPILFSTIDGIALPFFTDELRAKRYRDANFEEAEIEPIQTIGALRAYAEACRRGYNAEYVAIDPPPEGGVARCIRIDGIPLFEENATP